MQRANFLKFDIDKIQNLESHRVPAAERLSRGTTSPLNADGGPHNLLSVVPGYTPISQEAVSLHILEAAYSGCVQRAKEEEGKGHAVIRL